MEDERREDEDRLEERHGGYALQRANGLRKRRRSVQRLRVQRKMQDEERPQRYDARQRERAAPSPSVRGASLEARVGEGHVREGHAGEGRTP